MTIKQQGGIFGRNPTFNDLTVDGDFVVDGAVTVPADSISGDAIDGGTPTTDGITLQSASSPIQLKDASDVRRWLIQKGADDLFFYRYNTSGTYAGNPLTINSTTGLSTFEGSIKMKTAGTGIDFSATSGTGTSELFDDYEEGTWTATLFDANSGGNASSTTATGYYTKIGRIVNCIVSKFNNVDTTGMSGTLRMSLPFSPASGNFYSTGTASMNAGTFPANTYMLTVAVFHGEARAYLQAQGTNGFTSLGTTNITSGTTDLNQMTFSYIAA